MRNRVMRRAAVSAAILLLALTAVAYADVINADGDRVAPSAQTMVDLGTVGPGATITYNVYFLLECRNTAHVVPGSTITLTPQNPSFPPGGTISGTPTTIGPVPANWPLPGETCVGDPVLQSATASVVTIVAPTVIDTGYIYRLEYAKAPMTGLSGITTMTFRLAVGGNATPVVSVPPSQTVEGDTLGGWASSFSASAVDPEDGPVPTTCDPASGTVFPVGRTMVTCRATDSAGATGFASFEVTVVDTTPPTLAGLPADVALETEDQAGTTYAWASPTAVDIVSGDLAVTCDPASGSLFPLGPTTVTCSSSDAAGNAVSGTFVVSVTLVDRTPPALSGVPADTSVETEDPAGAPVSWPAPTAIDAVDGPVPVTCSPASGSLFPVGTTTVTCTATDAAGNTASQSFQVTVSFGDETPPVISGVPGDLVFDTFDPAGAAVSWPSPTAVDAVDGPVPVTCSPASGTVFPVGTTTVTCTATDAAGNAASRSFTVTVNLVQTGELSATWEGPGAGPEPFAANGRNTLPLKVRISVSGVEVVPPAEPRLYLERLAECFGGAVVETVDGGAFTWSGDDRWKINLVTGELTLGCWRVSVAVGDAVGGSFFMTVGHGEFDPSPSDTPNRKR